MPSVKKSFPLYRSIKGPKTRPSWSGEHPPFGGDTTSPNHCENGSMPLPVPHFRNRVLRSHRVPPTEPAERQRSTTAPVRLAALPSAAMLYARPAA